MLTIFNVSVKNDSVKCFIKSFTKHASRLKKWILNDMIAGCPNLWVHYMIDFIRLHGYNCNYYFVSTSDSIYVRF